MCLWNMLISGSVHMWCWLDWGCLQWRSTHRNWTAWWAKPHWLSTCYIRNGSVSPSVSLATHMTDVFECGTNNGGCTQNCHNTEGSYYCSCDSGYTLDSDDHGCTGTLYSQNSHIILHVYMLVHFVSNLKIVDLYVLCFMFMQPHAQQQSMTNPTLHAVVAV